LFLNKDNFNLKRNPYQKPIITHISPTLTLTSNLLKTPTIKPIPFKVQDLLEDLTLTLNPLKTLTIKPALPISPTVTIPLSAPTLTTLINSVAISTSAPTLTTPIVSAPAITELTPPPIPKITTALSAATCIPTEPQVQP
jgi:hypothetical protein